MKTYKHEIKITATTTVKESGNVIITRHITVDNKSIFNIACSLKAFNELCPQMASFEGWLTPLLNKRESRKNCTSNSCDFSGFIQLVRRKVFAKCVNLKSKFFNISL